MLETCRRRELLKYSGGTYVEMILFKASDCESKIYLYNSDTYDLKGYIDNNFVPTIQMLDLITKKSRIFLSIFVGRK